MLKFKTQKICVLLAGAMLMTGFGTPLMQPLASQPVQGAAEATTASIPYVTFGPAVDGIEDAVWASAATLTGGRILYGYTDAPDFGVTAKVLHDDANVYVWVNVVDETKRNDGGADWWNDDSIEFYIDGNNSRGATYDGVDDRQLSFRYNDATMRVGGPAVTGIEWRMVDIGNGYRLEAKLPKAALSITGAQFGLDVQVNDDDWGDRQSKWAWAGVDDNSYVNAGLFGVGVLQPAPLPISTPTPFPNSAIWQQTAKITPPSDIDSGAQFGFAIALTSNGNVLIVGAPYADVNGVTDAGAAYVYQKFGADWQFKQKLTSNVPISGANFGISIATDDNLVAIGSPNEIFTGSPATVTLRSPSSDSIYYEKMLTGNGSGIVYLYEFQNQVLTAKSNIKYLDAVWVQGNNVSKYARWAAKFGQKIYFTNNSLVIFASGYAGAIFQTNKNLINSNLRVLRNGFLDPFNTDFPIVWIKSVSAGQNHLSFTSHSISQGNDYSDISIYREQNDLWSYVWGTSWGLFSSRSFGGIPHFISDRVILNQVDKRPVFTQSLSVYNLNGEIENYSDYGNYYPINSYSNYFIASDPQARIYVLRYRPGVITSDGRLASNDSLSDDNFGFSNSGSDYTIAVGAPKHDSNGITDNGAVYIFTHQSGVPNTPTSTPTPPPSPSTCGASASANQLSNPNFTSDLSGWNRWDNNSSAVNGKLQIVGAGGIGQHKAASAGQSYSLKASSGSSGNASLGLNFYDAGWNLLSRVSAEAGGANATRTAQATAPANTALVEAWVWNSSGTLSADDFCLTGGGGGNPTVIPTPTPVITPSPSSTSTPAPASCTNNALANGGFENDFANWQRWDTASSIGSDAKAGSKALRIGPGAGGIGQHLAVTPGANVSLSTWSKLANGGSGGRIGLTFFNAQWQQVGSNVYADVSSAGYTRHDLSATVPAGASIAQVWAYKSGTSGEQWLDEVCLQGAATAASTSAAARMVSPGRWVSDVANASRAVYLPMLKIKN